MARSAHVATTTRKQVRAVPYAQPAGTDRSLSQAYRGLPRRKLHHAEFESLSKLTPAPGHASLAVSDPRMYSVHLPTFDTGISIAATGFNASEPTSYPPGGVTDHAEPITPTSSWYLCDQPSVPFDALQEGDLASAWEGRCAEVAGLEYNHTYTAWQVHPSQHCNQYLEQPLQPSEGFTTEDVASLVGVEYNPGLAAFGPQQTGPLYPVSYCLPCYPVIAADSSHALVGSNSTLLQSASAQGVMEESWVFEPAEPGFSSDHVDSGLAHAFENTSIPCVASSSDSEDGVWVEKPSVVDDYVHKQSESPPVQVTQTPAVIKRHTRSRLSPERRLQAASTRKWGACIRCYIQKIRCIPHPENPENSCCLTCASVSRESKKVIHRLPCLRLRLTEVVMFRGGGLNLTSRWTGTAMKNLSPNDWVNNELRILTWQLEHSPYPLQFTVKRFHPQAGDSLSRKWQDSNGQTRETRIEPFGLADIQKTANDYMAYNFTYSLASLNTVKQRMIGQVEDIVWRTYDEVSKLIVMTERPPGLRGKNVNPADFLHQYVKLWFGIRNSVGSAYITENTDTLDMGPESHPDYPYGARISIPRMVSEQFYNLQYERLLVPTRKRVLEDLNRMMTGKKPDHFFTVYLTVFMLLYETSVASADRHRRAAQYAEPTYYSLPLFVEQLQFGANIVLLHWHYYKRGFNPLRTDWSSVKDKAIWSTLTMEQRQFLCDSWRYFEDRAARPVEKMTWKNELYFVAQMFEDDLSLGETYPGN